MTPEAPSRNPQWLDQKFRVDHFGRRIGEGLRIVEAEHAGMDPDWRGKWLAGYVASTLLSMSRSIEAEAAQRVVERIRKDFPVAVLATDGGPTVAYAMRVVAHIEQVTGLAFDEVAGEEEGQP